MLASAGVDTRNHKGFDLANIQKSLDKGDSYRDALERIQFGVIGMGSAYDRINNKFLTNVEITSADVDRLLGIIKEIQGVCIRELA